MIPLSLGLGLADGLRLAELLELGLTLADGDTLALGLRESEGDGLGLLTISRTAK